MKHISTFACTVCIFLSACTKTIENEKPLVITNEEVTSKAKQKSSGDAQTINFTEQNLFPEGVVYDKFNNRFYVSSTTRGDIGIVKTDGSYTPFITDPDLIGTTGLEIDEARKLLYVANSTDGSVGIYKINGGQRVAFIDLKPLLPSATVFINDIALDPQGNAYITNSRAPVIYKITPAGKVSIFFQDEAFATPGFGFNGIEYAKQGFLLVAHTDRNAIVKIPVRNTTGYSIVSLDQKLERPDGLLLSTNGKELVVVNNAGGQNGKVISFTSSDKWQTGTATSSFETGPVFPTTATVAGKSTFVLYAYLQKRQSGQSVFTIQEIPGDEKKF